MGFPRRNICRNNLVFECSGWINTYLHVSLKDAATTSGGLVHEATAVRGQSGVITPKTVLADERLEFVDELRMNHTNSLEIILNESLESHLSEAGHSLQRSLKCVEGTVFGFGRLLKPPRVVRKLLSILDMSAICCQDESSGTAGVGVGALSQRIRGYK